MLPDKIEDVASGEIDRTVLRCLEPPIAEMFEEDDLLRINLEKDDMMIIMMMVVHNLISTNSPPIYFLWMQLPLLTSLS